MTTEFFVHPPQQPLDWLKTWLDDARQVHLNEPMAMSLATSTPDGVPSSRIVLFKGWDNDALCFYTNTQSLKGEQLSKNAAAALCFWWDPLMRQVRIQGVCEPLSAEQSDAYFAGRPRGSQLGAWASQQSQPIADRDLMESSYKQVEARFQEQAVPRPVHWGGYKLTMTSIEFWQGRDNRFHDRVRYTREGTLWTKARLQP